MPVSESIGLSEDKASIPHYSMHLSCFMLHTDSLCFLTIRGDISRILYEICSTSVKS